MTRSSFLLVPKLRPNEKKNQALAAVSEAQEWISIHNGRSNRERLTPEERIEIS